MTTTQLDHIVLLVSNAFFEDPPSWLTSNFTISPGGTHTGQASRNKLIFFTDGTYIELFNWYDVPPALDDVHLPMRCWGPKKEGLIDFALTSTTLSTEDSVSAINQRLSEEPSKNAGLGVSYPESFDGSRVRADGVEAKWKVTRPCFGDGENVPIESMLPGGRLDAPFFCHDVTERKLRVPSDDPEKATHPCGATGISAVKILVPRGLIHHYTTLYSKVIGSEPVEKRDGSNGTSFCLDVGIPQSTGRSSIVIEEAHNEIDTIRMQHRGVGISDIVIATNHRDDRHNLQDSVSEIGSTIWLV